MAVGGRAASWGEQMCVDLSDTLPRQIHPRKKTEGCAEREGVLVGGAVQHLLDSRREGGVVSRLAKKPKKNKTSELLLNT